MWVVDNGFAQIFKFTADGREMVLALGEKNVARQDESHFDGPNDIAFFPNGDFLVADGSRNRRIVKFSKEGKYLMEWGKRSPRPRSFAFTPPEAGRDMSEFGNLHAVAIDAKQRVYVSDWGHARVAIFDANGNFLEEWPNVPRASSISISTDQRYVWLTDDTYNKIMQFDMNGRLLDARGHVRRKVGHALGPASLERRYGRQSVCRRDLQRTRAKVQTEEGRGPEQIGRTPV